jgi:hypothetical protein
MTKYIPILTAATVLIVLVILRVIEFISGTQHDSALTMAITSVIAILVLLLTGHVVTGTANGVTPKSGGGKSPL